MNKHLRDSHLRLLWISRVDYQENSGVKPHYHDEFFQLILIIDGAGTIQVDSKDYSLKPEHCYIIPKGMTHHFKFSKNSTTIDIKFLILHDEIDKLLLENLIIDFKVSGMLLNKLKEVFKLSRDNLHNPSPVLPCLIDTEFKSFLLAYLKERNTKGNAQVSPTSISQELDSDFPIVEYLAENIQSKITLEDIAKHFNFHPHYLIELFRKKLGTTPMQFLQGIRVEKSKEYLEFTNLTIAEIAELVGLTAPYFSRLFRDRQGISPSDYREQARSVIGKDMILEEDFLLEKQPMVSKLDYI